MMTGVTFTLEGKFAEAERCLIRCLDLRVKAFQTDVHDHVLEVLNLIGKLYILANCGAEAVKVLERALEIAKIVHGDRAFTIVQTLSLLASALQRIEPIDFVKVEAYVNVAREITEQTYPDELHLRHAARWDELGALRFYQGNKDEAFLCFEKSLKIRQLNLGDVKEYSKMSILKFSDPNHILMTELPHPDIFQSLCQMGLIEFFRENIDEAINYLIPAVHLQHHLIQSNLMQPNFFIHEVLGGALLKRRMILFAL